MFETKEAPYSWNFAGGGGVLVERVFWCWLKGRFGGASLLMDGGGVLVEGAFWWRGRFGGRGVSVEEVCWLRGCFGAG